jgi:steroid 5-alpha reductase family enzyme
MQLPNVTRRHEEDYRWAVLRKQMSPFMLQVLNLTFVGACLSLGPPSRADCTAAVGQNIILLLLGMPAYYAVSQPHAPLVTSDYILAIGAVISYVVEFTADNQQYSFQTYKRTGVIKKDEWPGARIHWTPEDAKRGFVTKGLWAWSRHPNFYCEQGFWVRNHFCNHVAYSQHVRSGYYDPVSVIVSWRSLVPVISHHVRQTSVPTSPCHSPVLVVLLVDAV